MYRRLIDLVTADPSLNWSWHALSGNPAISIEDILRTPSLPWSYTIVVKREDLTLDHLLKDRYMLSAAMMTCDILTMDFVLAHDEFSWDWGFLSINPSISNASNIMRYPSMPWDWGAISRSAIPLPASFILKHMDKMWSWDVLSSNGYMVTQELLERSIDFPGWNWGLISLNRCVASISFIMRYPDKAWNWPILCMKHPFLLTLPEVRERCGSSIPFHAISHRFPFFDLILEMPHASWNWCALSTNKAIATPHNVSSHPDLPWEYDALSSMPDIFSLVISLPSKPWDWDALSLNETVASLHHLLMYPSLPWNWFIVSRNPSIATPDVWRSHPHLPWVPSQFARNSSFFSVETVSSFPLPWNWDEISQHVRSRDISFVALHPEIPWNWSALSRNRDFSSWENVMAHLNLPWDWYEISIAHASRSRIEDLSLPWDWYALSGREDLISMEMVAAYPERRWNWHLISRNPRIASNENIRAHPSLPWCLLSIVESNDNLLIDVMLSLIASSVPSYLYPSISNNHFTLQRELNILMRSMARRVQRWWKRVSIYDLSFERARKRARRDIELLLSP